MAILALPLLPALVYDHLQYQRFFIPQMTESWVGTWGQAKVFGTSIFCQGLIDPPKVDAPLSITVLKQTKPVNDGLLHFSQVL